MIIAPMQSLRINSSFQSWWTRLVTFSLATLAAASVGYWVLKWPTPASPMRAALPGPTAPAVDSAKVAQLLGASSASATLTPNPSSKYKLLGVIASGSKTGSALISIDDLPARPYRVGERLADDLLLQAVQIHSVTLAVDMLGAGSITLALPPLPGAITP